MKGVAANLDAALDDHCRQRGYHPRHRPHHAPLGEALRLLAREAMTGAPPPASGKRIVELWQDELGDAARADLAELAKVMHDQRAYAKATRRLLGRSRPRSQRRGSRRRGERAAGQQRAAGRSQRGQGRGRREGIAADAAEMEGSEGEEGQEDAGESDAADSEAEMKGEGGEDSPNRPGRPPESDPRKRGQQRARLSRLHRGIRRGRGGGRSLRRRRAGAAAPAARPAAHPSADRGGQARQPAAAPPAGQAEPELGVRSRGRPAGQRPACRASWSTRRCRSPTSASATPNSATRW